MSRRHLIAAIIALTAIQTSWAFAQQETPAPAITEKAQPQALSKLNDLITTNDLFMEAVGAALRQTQHKKAKALLERAVTYKRDGHKHFTGGDMEAAIEDYSESNHLAIQALISIKNELGATMRETAIEEAEIIQAGNDDKRKEEMINKAMAEAEIFIKTAQWLLLEGDSQTASFHLTEARTLYDKSKREFADGNYTEALEDVNKAYKTAADAVKIIKRERVEIITFPRLKSANEQDILESEMRKNDAYRFFASQLASSGTSSKASKYIRQGNSQREEAAGGIDGSNIKKAIELLKLSTDSYITAIKLSVK